MGSLPWLRRSFLAIFLNVIIIVQNIKIFSSSLPSISARNPRARQPEATHAPDQLNQPFINCLFSPFRPRQGSHLPVPPVPSWSRVPRRRRDGCKASPDQLRFCTAGGWQARLGATQIYFMFKLLKLLQT